MSALSEHILRNRQRLTIERLRNEAADFLPQDVQFADAVESANLGAKLRGALSVRRPEAKGCLQTTMDPVAFAEGVRAYFEANAGLRWYLFATHWTDAGALIATSAELVQFALPLLTFDGDTLYGCSSERSKVFVFDRTLDGGSVTFELFEFST